MDFTLQTYILLPIGLGLLGFVEPCTIGAHLLFLDTQKDRSKVGRINAVLVFVVARTLIAGLFGASIAFLGQQLIGVQTDIWLVFGLIYLAIGIAFLVGRAGLIKKRIDLAPAAWKHAQSPLVLGIAFGFNIPACAAPILFGLLGLAATTGTVLSGFLMMALFGFSLSLPLIFVATSSRLASWLDTLGQRLRRRRWVLGVLFILLGIWSVWFGLYVDPANWAGK